MNLRCVWSLFTHAGPSQPSCVARSPWDHRDMMIIRPLCLWSHQHSRSHARGQPMSAGFVSPNPFSPSLVCVCVSEFGLAAVWACGTTRTVGFLEQRGKVVPFLLSLVCHSQHSHNIKDVARAKWFMCCPAKWCGSFAKTLTKKKKKNHTVWPWWEIVAGAEINLPKRVALNVSVKLRTERRDRRADDLRAFRRCPVEDPWV